MGEVAVADTDECFNKKVSRQLSKLTPRPHTPGPPGLRFAPDTRSTLAPWHELSTYRIWFQSDQRFTYGAVSTVSTHARSLDGAPVRFESKLNE